MSDFYFLFFMSLDLYPVQLGLADVGSVLVYVFMLSFFVLFLLFFFFFLLLLFYYFFSGVFVRLVVMNFYVSVSL